MREGNLLNTILGKQDTGRDLRLKQPVKAIKIIPEVPGVGWGMSEKMDLNSGLWKQPP